MLALPPVLPDVCHRSSLRIGRDYVRFGTCDYSVHPRAIGRRAELKVDLDWVVVTLAGDEVARHRRSLAPHRTITDPGHSRARRALKETVSHDQPSPTEVDVEVRDLVTYDHALGVA
ncbi:MAG: hypothetical protein H0W55_13820 [Actinobacteria bacterium]|nr:hypothetical protein [Actinomycetota bacterium]MDQ3531076.1 hypothetical protein [Actinomycetota bacterium]